MSAINDGGPAFPRDHQYVGHNGISMRDYFAAKALQAWITSRPNVGGEPLNNTKEHADDLAETAYCYADAMLRAREETK